MNKYIKRHPAILLLEDGAVFNGAAAGKIGTAAGEICFNTGMTGYQEIFTDPSYFGQILVTAASHIGNYGIHNQEVESDKLMIAGLVYKKFSQPFSRASANSSIQDYFCNHGLIAISDVDTRTLVKHIRTHGAMNAIISSENITVDKLKQSLSRVPSMNGLELASKVTAENPYILGDINAKYKVAVLDLGVKKNILRCLLARGCCLQVFPMHTPYKKMKDWNPDGFLLSNGPGDPSAMHAVIKTVKELINGNTPVFGICLGHQLIALAAGISTYKMHNGHRGINHPVKNLLTGKCEITSQNHGFVVNMEAVTKKPNIEVTHVHLNDNTIAGLRMKDRKVFSVQFHPEASAGPNDSMYLFDEFIKQIHEALSGSYRTARSDPPVGGRTKPKEAEPSQENI